MDYVGIVVALLIVIQIFFSARKVSKQRLQIKEQANKDFDKGVEVDVLESRLGDAELMYEDLEETYWVHISALIVISTYFYWHLWYVSIAIGAALLFIGVKYLSLKPFSTATPDR